MLDRNCTEVTKVTRVKVGEKGRHAVFLNPEKREYLKIRIDGCIIVNQTACDYLVARDDVVGVLIELKGTDLPRALKQIEETLEYLKNKKVKYSRMAALIVCRSPSRHPSFTPKIQLFKNRLMSQHRMPLHIVTGNHEFEMEKVLSFRKPF
jgi:hypothetical protein